jgi:tetratricopeptide (TPR) repeat protein
MNLHAFVAMPFGKKPEPGGTLIDFNTIYNDLLKPAIKAAGFAVFRADQEQAAGDIKTDMLQELLIADLVIADLTLDNPNVWYELGVRHAIRASGIILVQGINDRQTFENYTDRKLNYNLKDGVPDPATLENDKKALTEMVKATLASSRHGRKLSPVYQLLPELQEPSWKSLRIDEAVEFWEAYADWRDKVELACQNDLIGDLLVLADEAPVAAFRAEAHFMAGVALRKAEQFDFALEQIEAGLAVDPENLTGLQEKGICLQHLALQGKANIPQYEVRLHYISMLKIYPNDPETWALLARIDKDAWIQLWRHQGRTIQQMRNNAADADARLRAAIESYRQAFRRNPGHYCSGINALTLMHAFLFLTGDTRFFIEAKTMAGAVRYVAEFEPGQSFCSKAALGDLEVLLGTPDTVTSAYKEAIAKSENDWYALNSTLSHLHLLKDLDFRPEVIDAGIATIEQALARLKKPEEQWQPRHVFLFNGLMTDAEDRITPRFPNDKSGIAAEKIAEVLAALGADESDLALTQGAAGGDILFAEACAKRGVHIRLLQPFPEAEFVQRAILSSGQGESWRSRYFTLTAQLKSPPRNMSDALGDIDEEDSSPYERCNLWLLYTALAYGIGKVRFICLWDGGDSGKPGCTAHLYQEVHKRTGQVTWLDTRKLW